MLHRETAGARKSRPGIPSSQSRLDELLDLFVREFAAGRTPVVSAQRPGPVLVRVERSGFVGNSDPHLRAARGTRTGDNLSPGHNRSLLMMGPSVYRAWAPKAVLMLLAASRPARLAPTVDDDGPYPMSGRGECPRLVVGFRTPRSAAARSVGVQCSPVTETTLRGSDAAERILRPVLVDAPDRTDVHRSHDRHAPPGPDSPSHRRRCPRTIPIWEWIGEDNPLPDSAITGAAITRADLGDRGCPRPRGSRSAARSPLR